MGIDVIGVKVLSGFLFFTVALLFGLLPFFVFRRCLSSTTSNAKSAPLTPGRAGKVLIQCLHALASGVLIATCLLHLLPESLENVQEAQASRHPQRLSSAPPSGKLREEGNVSDSYADLRSSSGIVFVTSGKSKAEPEVGGSSYPVAELMVAIGFLAIFIIDTTMRAVQSRKDGVVSGDGIKYSRLKNVDDGGDDDGDDEIELFAQKAIHSLQNNNSRERMTSSSSFDKKENDSAEDTRDANFTGDDPKRSSSPDDFKRFPPDELVSKQQDHVRSIALVMALCIHGFFDGVIVGLQTSTSTLFSLLVALLLHKSFVATSLSLTLLKIYSTMTSRLRVFVYVILFASVAPVGIVMSAAFIHSHLFATQNAGEVSLAPGCVQAFAVGTFLYVTFTEATDRHGEVRSLKMEILCHVFLLVGFFFMAMMRLTFGES